MAIEVDCPNGCRFRMPDRALGSQVRCPICKAILSVDPILELAEERQANSTLLRARAPDVEEVVVNQSEMSEPSRSSADEFSFSIRADPSQVRPEPKSLAERVSLKLTGRKQLAWLFAGVVLALTLITIAPALIEIYRWQNDVIGSRHLGRWAYLTFFGGLMHVFFGILLVQIPDWSALKATSGFLLAAACVYAILGAALFIPGDGNVATNWMQLPFSLRASGVKWTLAMVCLYSLVSCWAFREYSLWRKTERLFLDLYSDRKNS